ncbi:MAG: DMT family transporter [Candidatus Hermodarchaeota archaeon]
MLGEIIAILAVLTFVVSNVIFRKTELEASPIFINLFRTITGMITFFLLSLFLNVLHYIFVLPFEIWLLLFISFLFGQVIGDTAYFIAQKELGTTIALAVSMTFPIFTFILSLFFLERPFEIRMLFSLILVVTGILIIGKNKITTSSYEIKLGKNKAEELYKPLKSLLKNTSFKALLAGVIASLGWATGLVIIDFTTNEIDNLLATNEISSILGNTIRFPFAVLILTLMYVRENKISRRTNTALKSKRSRRTYMLLILGSIIGTSLGAYLYTEAARVAGANIMSLIATASPLFALPLTYWVNKEKITKLGFLGVILTIIGVLLIII